MRDQQAAVQALAARGLGLRAIACELSPVPGGWPSGGVGDRYLRFKTWVRQSRQLRLVEDVDSGMAERAKPRANEHSHQTTPSHMQPRSVQSDGTPGHARRRPATRVTRLTSDLVTPGMLIQP